jgi:1-acyl-sn-glycerol-3-phosphate acyltransferase
MKFFYWLTTSTLALFFKIFYRHKVYGLEHIQKGRAIIAPNHTSFFDPPIIAASLREEMSFLARKTLFDSSFFGWLIGRLNAYPVTGTTQDLNSIKLICKLLSEDKKVVIFPEGLRSSDGTLGNIKSGIGMLALRAQSPVIPVYLSGCFEVWGRSRRFPRLKGKTACVFGTPIEINTFNDLAKKEAQEAIATSVKTAITNLEIWYKNGAQGSPP